MLMFFAEKKCDCKSYSHFFSQKIQHICVSLYVNFNESLTNGIVSFEQLGPVVCCAITTTKQIIIIIIIITIVINNKINNKYSDKCDKE